MQKADRTNSPQPSRSSETCCVRITHSQQDVLKLGDFGSCRSVYSKQPYTEYISTRWYRAPECLLTDGFYTYKMDMWSAGCVLYEVASLQPLFPGANELDQISRIHDIIGTPTENTLAKFKQATEKQALASHWRKATTFFPKHPVAPELLSSTWQTPKEGQKQANTTCGGHGWLGCRVCQGPATPPDSVSPCWDTGSPAATVPALPATLAEIDRIPSRSGHPPGIRVGGVTVASALAELHARRSSASPDVSPGPGLLAGVTKLSSYSSLALQSVLAPGANGRVPLLRPLKCVGANQKTDAQKDIKPTLKQRRLPTVDRRGGGC
ncbi:MAPK/MAK/MRK overlapping kinase-like protein [Camelus ferus]|nr:MAPK/MAK/MRK overlapping kinase-like protein [Camelus ferus]